MRHDGLRLIPLGGLGEIGLNMMVLEYRDDHIGALPFILKELKVPVYGTPFTLALVAEKLQEHEGIGKVTFKRVRPRDQVEIGPFRVELIRTCHSLVDGTGLEITTPVGVVIHTGDFKIDQA